MSGFLGAVVAHLWQATLVLALIGLLALALRRAPARYVEGLWSIGLVKLLVPLPLLAAAWPAVERFLARPEPQGRIAPAMQTLSQIAYPEMLWAQPLETGGGGVPHAVLVALVATWGLGTLALIARWWARGRMPSPPGEAPWHAAAEVAERLTRVAREAGVPLNRIRLTSVSMVPCVRNLWRPMVVLSEGVVRSLRDDELRAVLLHENAHRRRGDLWRSMVEAVVTRVFFFYPPVWWLSRRLRASAEMACDEAVLAAGIDARTYARALARTVVLELEPSRAPALSSGRSHLHARLQRIQEPERYVAMKHHRFALIVAVAVAVGTLFVSAEPGVAVPGASTIRSAEELPLEQRQGEWMPASELRGLNGLNIVLDLPERSVRVTEVLEELGRRAGFEVYVSDSEELNQRVTITTRPRTRVSEALGLLGVLAGLEYRVVDRNTLIVRLRPEVRAQRELEQLDRALEREVPRETAVERTPAGTTRTTGTMRVRALGPDGAPLPGVRVVARGPGGSRTQYTAIDGTARFPALDPGAYTATFILNGFETLERSGLQIAPQRTVAFDTTLERSRASLRGGGGSRDAAPLRVGGDIQPPERIHYVQPQYPELARRARMEGFVILQAVVDPQGNVKDAEVLRGLGLGLDEAAREAVMQWRYTPTRYNGSAVEVILTVNVVFELIQ